MNLPVSSFVSHSLWLTAEGVDLVVARYHQTFRIYSTINTNCFRIRRIQQQHYHAINTRFLSHVTHKIISYSD